VKPGASVVIVAQRYGVNANLLFTWRRQEAAGTNGGAEPVKLVPVTVAEAEAPSAASVAAPEPIGRMEIVLSGRGADHCRRGRRRDGAGARGQNVDAPMIPVPAGVRVWLATGRTDMRKGWR
jgi:hypothetical protein